MPTTRKEIERFISEAIRSSKALDEHVLRAHIAGMEPQSLQAYWQDLVTRAASCAANQVPDWKTRERRSAFEDHLARSAYIATEGASFQDHVCEHLKAYVTEEQSQVEAFKRLPWLARLQVCLGFGVVIAAFLTAPLLMLGMGTLNSSSK